MLVALEGFSGFRWDAHGELAADQNVHQRVLQTASLVQRSVRQANADDAGVVMDTAERWVTIFERVVHTVYRMKLGQIDYGPRDTSGWLLWRSERMPPTTLANRGGYVTVVYVAELSWAESNELIEAVLTCDAETFRGVGPNRMSTMDCLLYTSPSPRD